MRGTLHAGLVILPISEEAVTTEGLYREALILALPTGHPLATKDIPDHGPRRHAARDHSRGHRATIRRGFESDFCRGARTSAHRPTSNDTSRTARTGSGKGSLAGLTMPWAQQPAREGIVFRRLADEFLTAEVGLAYLRDDGSPILKSLRKFLIDTFQPLSPELKRSNAEGAR